jgi:hypothetical protein
MEQQLSKVQRLDTYSSQWASEVGVIIIISILQVGKYKFEQLDDLLPQKTQLERRRNWSESRQFP